ncbi:hypothetical protein [Hydrogenophaga sp. BPS33]|uniref:hypothetical protein n=1 Tax=Hydrogenophaga sp. BPS33 TaxID=2651974 RepID=UPI00131FA3EC|nr:hypothetical protein [Hydrogenophaga sp. BPS33]QHE88269.1 hypothetical protein F9K07_26990 [Hydrogenophaga sp. BPS33]
MTLEYWKYDAGSDSVASLVIPAALGRQRTFDLDATLRVQVPADAPESSHELAVEVDGRRLWARRIPSQNPGETDGLEYHCRLTVEADADCRVRAKASCKGSRVLSLVVEARETAY